MRRLLSAIIAATVVGALATGCTDAAITDARLQASVASTFANLWVLQQSEQGHPHPGVGSLHPSASCHRGRPGKAAVGAASDWVCSVTWLVDGPSTPATALYQLAVTTNGCYASDGDGPTSLNGSATVPTPSGATTTNPLWKFNGCFDTT